MTYFGFLALFLAPPLLLFSLLNIWDERNGRLVPVALRTWSPLAGLVTLVFIAVTYTTPWDNYLVATRVWWYDPALVSGLVIGWVPIEEYTFFVLQTVMTGLWTIFLARRLGYTDAKRSVIEQKRGVQVRIGSFAVVTLIWFVSLWILFSDWRAGRYLALELSWALPPILLQIGFGGDILWKYRRLVFWSLLPVTLYLCIGDSIAIGSGTWTISPEQSMGLLVGNLPIEEIIFFILTNVLVVFGMVLFPARDSHERMPLLWRKWLSDRFGEPNLSS